VHIALEIGHLAVHVVDTPSAGQLALAIGEGSAGGVCGYFVAYIVVEFAGVQFLNTIFQHHFTKQIALLGGSVVQHRIAKSRHGIALLNYHIAFEQGIVAVNDGRIAKHQHVVLPQAHIATQFAEFTPVFEETFGYFRVFDFEFGGGIGGHSRHWALCRTPNGRQQQQQSGDLP
jgi:hypothetical protein